MRRKYRLLKNEDFKNAISKKNVISDDSFVIYTKRNNLENSRFGISVSSKIGNSVVRHKIKRQVNEILKSKLYLINSTDFVLIIKEGYLKNQFSENTKKIDDLLNKIKIRMEKKNEKI